MLYFIVNTVDSTDVHLETWNAGIVFPFLHQRIKNLYVAKLLVSFTQSIFRV